MRDSGLRKRRRQQPSRERIFSRSGSQRGHSQGGGHGRGEPTWCSSQAKATRTIRSSVRKGDRSVIRKRRPGPLRRACECRKPDSNDRRENPFPHQGRTPQGITGRILFRSQHGFANRWKGPTLLCSQRGNLRRHDYVKRRLRKCRRCVVNKDWSVDLPAHTRAQHYPCAGHAEGPWRPGKAVETPVRGPCGGHYRKRRQDNDQGDDSRHPVARRACVEKRRKLQTT